MSIAVIPARGGSKRIKHKNRKIFCGKPLIAYSIENALKTELFDQVIVSTDCNQIAQIALEYGAKVPFIRPLELSDDFTGTTPVVQHAIQWYLDNVGSVGYCCCIYPTAPLLDWRDLNSAFDALIKEPSKQYAFSVCSFSFPVQRALIPINTGVQPMFPEHIGSRSQDLQEAVHDAGQFYWGRTEAFLSGVPLFSEYAIPYQLLRYRVQDIDTEEDWLQAELMYKVLQQKKELANAD